MDPPRLDDHEKEMATHIRAGNSDLPSSPPRPSKERGSTNKPSHSDFHSSSPAITRPSKRRATRHRSPDEEAKDERAGVGNERMTLQVEPITFPQVAKSDVLRNAFVVGGPQYPTQRYVVEFKKDTTYVMPLILKPVVDVILKWRKASSSGRDKTQANVSELGMQALRNLVPVTVLILAEGQLCHSGPHQPHARRYRPDHRCPLQVMPHFEPSLRVR